MGKCFTQLTTPESEQWLKNASMSWNVFKPKKTRKIWGNTGSFDLIITMKYKHLPFLVPNFFLAGLVFLSLSVNVVLADTLRQQTVNLHKGWNAVFLQVNPTNDSPANCFQGTPVTLVAQFVGNIAGVQYVQNPSTNSVNRQGGWLVWYAPSRPDAFLTQLFALSGNTSYLVYLT
jgi:hypothetical protein